MLDNSGFTPPTPLRVVIVTLDSHLAGPAERAQAQLSKQIPGLELSVHAAAEWAENPARLEETKAAVATADIIVCTLLFIDEHIRAILPSLEARRDHCDAIVGCIAGAEIVRLTKLGNLDMSKPASGAMKLLKSLRGSKKPSGASGAKQMKMLRRLPRILKFIPGKAQDLRSYFLTMQYWLAGSDENTVAMITYLVSTYARGPRAALAKGQHAAEPVEYPETGLYHPDLPGRMTTDLADLPGKPGGRTVGLLLLRSYVLAGDTAHYDGVIRGLEARGLRVLPAFAGGLDGRPAMEAYFRRDGQTTVDAMVSLTGFSLVGGPAYNDSDAAEDALADLDVPYVSAHALEFQTLGQWQASGGGLSPIEATMLVALPEIDGATNPMIFGGRLDSDGCHGCPDRSCPGVPGARTMAPCPERIEQLAGRVSKLANLRRSANADRKVAVVLYGFPPNAGAIGTAAYLGVFESLFNVLTSMKAEGYTVDVPQTVDQLRDIVLGGNAATYGQEANVLTKIPANDLVTREPHLKEIEAQWGPAPGRAQSDGSGVFVLGADLGNVMIGVQPAFGYEGDPMRLLFEGNFTPTHAFSAFYRYLREDFAADVTLHFGMHGALEFMPGKQIGAGQRCWPDRLIGDMPNVYLYAANNPSEASLAKRRSGAVTISHLTPPVGQAGLYKGLIELKASLDRWRAGAAGAPERADLADLILDQAKVLDLVPETQTAWDHAEFDIGTLWAKILDTEQALIPQGLHVVGNPINTTAMAELLATMATVEGTDDATLERAATLLAQDAETPALLRALQGRFIRPVPGGDLLRSPDILPTGRNLHAFDPFRMPTSFALQDGVKQAAKLLLKHTENGADLPRSVAMVLWGSDNIKSDGGPIAQALALMGARPRFDGYGRLCGAELIPLEDLGRPRIDVVMTLSGIFRDMLPLQTRMLAEAAWLAATADEDPAQNYIRANAMADAEAMGIDLESAALRVFSNAEGAYGANVNQMVDSGAWTDEDELADAYESRKGFAYGRDGKAVARRDVLKAALAKVDLAYQNLESVELGVTTVDHYFDTLGGVGRAVKRAKGTAPDVYIGDQTRGDGKVRTLSEQVALETRSRALNPKFYEPLLNHGHEGVRAIEAHVTNTMGWSATTGQVEPWVYQRITETFVLDDDMRRRLADLNPAASTRMANRLLEAHERDYWQPDDATLEALRAGAEELEDRLEGLDIPAASDVAAE